MDDSSEKVGARVGDILRTQIGGVIWAVGGDVFWAWFACGGFNEVGTNVFNKAGCVSKSDKFGQWQKWFLRLQ